MKGLSQKLGISFLILGVLFPAFSSPLYAQTAEERARAEELRKREQEIRQELEFRLQEVQEERLARLEEALAKAREQMAQVQAGAQEFDAARLEHLEQALAQAKAQLEQANLQGAQALAERQIMAQREFLEQRKKAQTEAMAQMEEARRSFEDARALQFEAQARARAELAEAKGLRERDASRYRALAEEFRQQALEQEKKIREMVVSVRSRVRLGVSLAGTQEPEVDRLGARLQSVMEDTPAEAAGLREGDIITHLNGRRLTDPIPGEEEEGFDDDRSLPVQRLISLAGELEAGDEVEVRYLRDSAPATVTLEAAEIDEPSVLVYGGTPGEEGARRILQVGPGGEGVWSLRFPDDELVELKLSELGELKDLEDLRVHLKDLHVDLEALEDMKVDLEDLYVDSPRLRVYSHPENLVGNYAFRGEGERPFVYNVLGSGSYYGLDLTELNPGLAEYFSTDAGILVLEVDDDSSLGLQAGDVILAIDGRELEEQRDVGRILRSYEEDEEVSFSIIRKGREITVAGTIR